MPQHTLIVGGARSGKSRLAERLVAAAASVTYVAPGYLPGEDLDWAARVAAHQARRPESWRTVETTDVAGVLAGAGETAVILIDCLATWLTRVLDEAGAWSQVEGWQSIVDAEADRLVAESATKSASAWCRQPQPAGCSAICWDSSTNAWVPAPTGSIWWWRAEPWI
jgi:adenosyl cobinamide kinase/adenosyl cobinamide phosphate guanylyltransferase